MPTPPEFSVGQYNTAAYMNAVGLWLVKTQTVGTGVSSVTVTGAFSSDYENYHITWTNVTLSAGDRIDVRIGNATANYDLWMVYGNYAGGGAAPVASGLQNQPIAYWVGGGDSNAAIAEFDLFGPNLPRYTYYRNTGFYYAQQGAGWMAGRLKDTTQHTSFLLSTGGATMTGGTIRVYGYRN